MSPTDVLKSWIEAFNSADVEKLAGLYHEDAVNHQVANEPIRGREAIREMFQREFAQAEIFLKTSFTTASGRSSNGRIRPACEGADFFKVGRLTGIDPAVCGR